MTGYLIETIKSKFPGSVLETHAFRGDETVVIQKEALSEVAVFLKDELGFDFLMDLAGVDYLSPPKEGQSPPSPRSAAGVRWDLSANSGEPSAPASAQAGGDRPRFELVCHFYSTKHNYRLRLKCPIAGENPVVDSLTALWAGANWFEREAYDMFGIQFSGHPDLRRILMYDGFEGHPLRKDYPLRKRQPRIPHRD